MSFRSVRSTRAALLAALALSAAACDDPLTAPGGEGPGAARPSAAGAASTRPRLVSNQVRYRYNGHRPATGRAGSAEVVALALAGRDGRTEVELSVAAAFLGYPTTESIEHVQTKAYDPSGRLMTTVTHPGVSGPRASFTYGGIGRGARVDVQALVRGTDGNRTDVVAVSQTVRLRPNLKVAAVAAPPRVREGTAVNISATIAETNGDVGATSACNLYVDGQQVDWARYAWVDAGDRVTCIFTHRFRGAGKHRAEVRLEGSQPRDDDPRDDAAAVEVEVYTSNDLIYSASAQESVTRSRYAWTSRWSHGSGSGEYRSESADSSHSQAVEFYGWVPRAVAWPARVEVAERTGATQIHAAAYELSPWDPSQTEGCATGWDAAAAAYYYLCSVSWEGGSTSVGYSRYAGRVAYHSSSYSRTWDGLSGNEYVYSHNQSYDFTSGLLVPFGDSYALTVRVVDGDVVHAAEAVMPLAPFDYSVDYPLACQTFTDIWTGGLGEECMEGSYAERTKFGSATSAP